MLYNEHCERLSRLDSCWLKSVTVFDLTWLKSTTVLESGLKSATVLESVLVEVSDCP